MRDMRDAAVLCLIIFLAVAGCAATRELPARDRQWQEGSIIRFHDGYDYYDGVDTGFPHYHVEFGRYYETHEPSTIHYHKSLNPKGPPNQYVLCYAAYADGQWVHKPQWYHDEMRRQRGRGGSR